MNRLQKKCLIVSMGSHLSLALVLLVGPAFLSPRSVPDNTPPLDFIPAKTVDALVSGGGNPRAQLPPPPQQEVTPPPLAPSTPTPPTPPVKSTPTPEPPKDNRHVVVPNLTKTVRKPDTAKETRTTKPQENTDTSNQAAQQISQAVRGIRGSLSPSTSIEMKGPGGGGLHRAGLRSQNVPPASK